MHTKQLFSISETKIGSIIFKSRESIIHSHQHIGQFAIDQMSVVCLCFVFVFVFVFSHFGPKEIVLKLSFFHFGYWYYTQMVGSFRVQNASWTWTLLFIMYHFFGLCSFRLGWFCDSCLGSVGSCFLWCSESIQDQFCMYCSL